MLYTKCLSTICIRISNIIMNRKNTLYYDAHCDMCIRWCHRICTILFLKNLECVDIASHKEAHNYFEKEYSWAFYEADTKRMYGKSSVLWRLIQISPFFSYMFYVSCIPGVIWLGDRIYDYVARSRTSCKVEYS